MPRHCVRVWIALAASVTGFASPPTRAEEPEAPKKSVTEQVLEILREQGAIDPARYEALKHQLEEEERARQPQAGETKTSEVAKATPAAPTPDPKAWTVDYKEGLRIERNDGLYKLHLGGLIQLDFAGISTDQALKDEGFDNQGTGEQFRRARIVADGQFHEYAIFKAQYDFAGGDVNFADVYLGLQDIPYVGQIRIGHFKEPMSLSVQTSDEVITTFLERSLPVDAFAPNRNTGIAIFNNGFDQRMTWAVGGFRDANDFGDGFSSHSPYNVTARITGLPVWEENGETLLHVGYSYSHQFRDNEDLSYSPHPEVHLSGPIVDTGDIPSHGADIFGVELATVNGPLSLQSEFLDTLVEEQRGPHRNLYGAYGEIAYFLTGEHRAYDPKKGHFGRTIVNSPFSIAKGQWGAFELAARYSYLDLNDGDIRGGIESNITAAANWLLYSNMRLMLNYVWAHRNDVGDQNAVTTRVNIDF